MPIDRSKLTLLSNPSLLGAPASPIVASCDDNATSIPFAVVRYDRRTRDRIYSSFEDRILTLIDNACGELSEAPISARSKRSHYYVKHLIKLGLDRDRSERVLAVIMRAATSETEWTDELMMKIASILHDVLPPITKPAKPTTMLALDHVRREFAKCGWDTCIIIEGSVKKLVLLDPLHREIARFLVRDGDNIHARDMVLALQDAERRHQSHS